MGTGLWLGGACGEFLCWVARFCLQIRVFALLWFNNLYICFRWLSVFVLFLTTETFLKSSRSCFLMHVPRLQVPEVRFSEPERGSPSRHVGETPRCWQAAVCGRYWGAGEGSRRGMTGQVFTLERPLSSVEEEGEEPDSVGQKK